MHRSLPRTSRPRASRDLRPDPASDEDAANSERLQREVARFGAVDGREQVEGLDAEGMAAGQPDLGDDGARIVTLDPLAQPRGLRRIPAVAEKSVGVEEPRSAPARSRTVSRPIVAAVRLSDPLELRPGVGDRNEAAAGLIRADGLADAVEKARLEGAP